MEQPEVLGLREITATWRVEAVPDLPEILDLLSRLIRLVGMESYALPFVLSFPTPGGKGGVGYQVYQGLVESFAVVGTWPELGFIRITLSSCSVRLFNPNEVSKWLSREFGFVVKQIWGET